MGTNVKQRVAFGIGAVGKDMVYALSSSFVMYFYQDLLGLNPAFVGTILMIARIFDAFNDPLMGVLVAKTRSRWGRFRPWLFSGTVLNALVLYALFRVPGAVAGSEGSLMVWFTVVYILWGMTYTMMDIPYWSMIPAIGETPRERESLSVIGRTCAGVGSALIQVGTMIAVGILGSVPEGEDVSRAVKNQAEIAGFAKVAMIVSLIFVVTEVICCLFVKERHESKMQTVSVKQMFRSLIRNDQAMVTVVAILLINAALYITSNFVLYFFKYDMGGEGWKANYTMFTAVGGATQILSMMVLFPLLRKKFSTTQIFNLSLVMSMVGYVLLLLLCALGMAGSLAVLCVPGVLIFGANGMLTVLTTVFLTSTVDYAELKNGTREESVIFSMQTFVVKAASGVAVFLVGIGLQLIGMGAVSGKSQDELDQISLTFTGSMSTGLRLMMTLLPILGLIIAFIFFNNRFKITDQVAEENARKLLEKHGGKQS